MRRNLTRESLSPKQVKRFWSLIDIAGPDDCWTWHGSTHDQGYGRIQFGRVRILAHRLAYILANGNIDPDLNVLHSCDNPPCCNPAHLFPGTQTENNQDRQRKGRSRGFVTLSGREVWNAKLTAEDVRAIRDRVAAGDVVAVIARDYHVWATTIWSIVKGETWKHVE